AKALVAGTRISIRFESGRLNANAGCNHLGGPYSVESGTLVVNDLAMTDMACMPATRMDQDTWLAAVLTARPTIDLDGDTLMLASGPVELTMKDRRTVDPDRSLAGPRWRVESIIAGDAVSSTPQEAEAHLTFTSDGQVDGSTGCNEFHGSYQAAGGMITFSKVGMTKKACPGAVNVLERAVTALFDGRPAPYRIEADQLTVTYPTGNGGLQLRAAA
ncbi:MAG: META domain-containing protein, partial [Micromonosporaceae bacterium]